MRDQLLVIVPSRGRPQNIARLRDGWDARARLLVGVDLDDPEIAEYIALGVEMAVRPSRGGMGPLLNELAVENAPGYRYLGFMGDDHLPRTPGWDETICAALAELGTGIVYGDDLLQGQRLPTAVFMTSDIVRTLGYMAPLGQQHLYIDDFWLALGQGAERLQYLPDVVIEHIHPFAGKAPFDDRYRAVNNAAVAGADAEAWFRFRHDDLAGAILAVRALCAS